MNYLLKNYHKKTEKNKQKILTSDACIEKFDQEVVEDPRPAPHYEVTFRERVTPSNVYLPVRTKVLL